MDPVTRKEKFLAKAGGQSVATPEPITREEIFLQRIAENGGSGGASSWNDLPMIDLVALGMPAVAVGENVSIDIGGEELKTLMKKGVFQYKALFAVEEGVNLEVLATVNGFSCEIAGLYQATSLMSMAETRVLLVLNAGSSGITFGVFPLTA